MKSHERESLQIPETTVSTFQILNHTTIPRNLNLRGELGEMRIEGVNGGNRELRFLRGIVRYANAIRSSLPSLPWQLDFASDKLEMEIQVELDSAESAGKLWRASGWRS